MLRLLATCAAVVLALLGLPGTSHAQNVTWGVRPADSALGEKRPNFSYSVVPGAVLTDALAVSNHEKRALTFAVYAADAFTTSSGQLDLKAAGEPSTGAGSWVAFDSPAVTVQAGQTVAVPFTVKVPADATPGDHSGGVITSIRVEAESGITVDRRLGSRMHLRVAGTLAPSVEIRDVAVHYDGTPNPVGKGTARVEYTVVNTGNVRLTAAHSVRLRGMFGWFAADARIDPIPELLPGESVVRTASAAMPPSGRVSAAITVTPAVAGGAELEPVTATPGTLALPWSAAVCLLLVVCLVLALRARAKSLAALEQQRIDAAVAAALKKEA
ncbi:WxL protein peptidoglycan domain-containing protein [Lentzea sp. NPDC058436]|uniref:WxL protein peptidoglycan domain-containing protein n=1 Tax=Lentzea sp. NPDC058436 TaxID=3346499 RepID=UPI00365205A1